MSKSVTGEGDVQIYRFGTPGCMFESHKPHVNSLSDIFNFGENDTCNVELAELITYIGLLQEGR